MKANLSAQPASPFGVIESTDDATITALYGFGSNDCASITSATPTPLTPTVFEAGLMDERAQLAGFPLFGSWLFTGTQHTSLGMASFGTEATPVNGQNVLLTTWIANLVGGTMANDGP